MEYYTFIQEFKRQPKHKRIFNDTQEFDEFLIKSVNNFMIDGNTLRALRMLEGLDNNFKRDYIMNKVLRLVPK